MELRQKGGAGLGNNGLDLAQVYALLGRADAAVETLAQILAGTGYFSVWDVKFDPDWDPIRNDPRFQALIDSAKSNEK